ncbi:MAG: condensation domain-containing protein, partial [Blastocatellia bacterium]
RYYSADERVRLELSRMRPSQILFNYLGQTDRALGSGSGWKADIESVGPARSGRQLRDYLLEINGLVADGQVKLSFSYSKNFHDRATVERLSGSFNHYLLALIDHCCHPAAGGFTPSDLPLASLNQESLDVLFDALKAARGVNPRSDVIDVYRLSPVQQGMLFHTLYRPESSTYFNQLSCVIEGPLNPAAFKEAWSKTIEHHASLRTSFHWEGLEGPIQVVHRSTPAQWMDDDGDQIAPEAADRQWQEYLEQDRNRRFDLARPPLMRFGLVRLHSGSHRFNWSYHHLLLDGWSLAIILNDMLVAYQSILRSEPVQLAVNRQFRENIEWLSRADVPAAEGYW